MKEKIKYALTIMLIAFVSFTLAFQIVKKFRKVEPLKLADGLNVVCAHATIRCPTCLTMERLTRELLESDFPDMVKTGKIIFREVDYEHVESNDFSNEYKIATAAVVLVNIRDGKTVAGVNLVDQAWKYFTDGPAFKTMLKGNIEAMLQGKNVESGDSSDEIDLEGDDLELNF